MRGALFSALEAMGADFSRVLDLYAGTGALGIEALSRGGHWCDFVERDRAMAGVIRENLRLTGFAERAKVYPVSSSSALRSVEGPYTLVLADPPYDDASAFGAVEAFAQGNLISDDAVVVFEHRARQEPAATLGGLGLVKTLRHGDSAVSIYASDGR
jgi:16S rRNA (guanine966-N2)-methyltransferase